jgi:hypothetical protein
VGATDGDDIRRWTAGSSAEVDMFKEDSMTRSDPSPTPLVANMDTGRDNDELHQAHSGHSNVALPNWYSGKKNEFWRFCHQFGLYITAHEEDFENEKDRILFILSYMTSRAAELWADAYIEEVLRISYWGSWVGFMEKLASSFRDVEEGRKSLEAMATLRQVKTPVAKYFFKLEQLTHNAGVNLEDSHHMILQIEWGVSLMLIDWLYQSPQLQNGYQEYKEWIISMDEMWRKRKKFCKMSTYWPTERMAMLKKNANAMDVDKKKMTETQQCYQCQKMGHLARLPR